MTTVSLRSLVTEIMNDSTDSLTFDANYKKLQRMHRLFCGITGKDFSTSIEETAKDEYVSLMRILINKFATTSEGEQIEKIMKKQARNNEKLKLPSALEDTLLEWFKEAYKEAALKSNNVEVMTRYQSILLELENDKLLKDIESLINDDLMQMFKPADNRITNRLLLNYMTLLQSEEMEEHRKIVYLVEMAEELRESKEVRSKQ